jgi:ABC-type amino acid transport substrate-binding protein
MSNSRGALSSMATRRRVLAGLAGLAAAGLAGPAAFAAPMDKVRAAGTLRIAVYRDFAPWSWKQDGKMVGLDVELGALLAAELGLKADYMDIPADESVEDDLRNAIWRGSLLGGGVADVMMHVPVDPQFSKRIDKAIIGVPYFRERFMMACDAAKVNCDSGVAQLIGATVGVELDSAPDMYLLAAQGGQIRPNLKHYVTGDQAVSALRKGEVAAVMVTQAQVEAGLAGWSGQRATYPGPFPGMGKLSWNVGLAVNAESQDLMDALGAAMEKLVTRGALAELFAKNKVTLTAPGV